MPEGWRGDTAIVFRTLASLGGDCTMQVVPCFPGKDDVRKHAFAIEYINTTGRYSEPSAANSRRFKIRACVSFLVELDGDDRPKSESKEFQAFTDRLWTEQTASRCTFVAPWDGVETVVLHVVFSAKDGADATGGRGCRAIVSVFH